MRRGEVHVYRPVVDRGGVGLRLIVSTDALVDRDLPVVFTVSLSDEDPGGLLAVPVDVADQRHWASIMTLQPAIRSRLDIEVHAVADAETMDHVGVAIRTMLDL